MKVFNLAEELEKERQKNKKQADYIYELIGAKIKLQKRIDTTLKFIEDINNRFEKIPDKDLITNRAIDISVIEEINNILKGEE